MGRLVTKRALETLVVASVAALSSSAMAQAADAPSPTTQPSPATAQAPAVVEKPKPSDGLKKRPGPAPSAVEPASTPARPALKPGEKRPVQDYDGREDTTSTAEDALWLPRIVLFPVYLVVETFIRLPVGALTVAVESNDVIGELTNVFLFGPDNNIGIVPTAFVDFGFRPSFGIYSFWNDFLVKGNDLRLNLGFGGVEFWRASIADRIPVDTPIGTARAKSFLQVEANVLTRSDLAFWGIGPRSRTEDEGGYSVTTFGGGGRAHVEPWRGTFLEAWATVRKTTTGAGACSSQVSIIENNSFTRICETPTIRRNILDGVYEAPPQYGRPYTTVKTGIRAALDSREERPAPGSGVAVDLSGELVTDIDEPKLGSWINYGATAAGFVDLTGTQRVLSLTIAARFQDALEDNKVIPFTELVGATHIENVPDLDLLRGFLPGRLLGSSAIAATVEYHWPIWAFLDGTMQAAVGNVFNGAHLDDFDPELLRFSFLGGIRSPNHRDHSFNLLVGFGTEPFVDGGSPTSFRFLIGGTTGF